MKTRSIRNRLLWSMLAVVGVVWAAATVVSYFDAHRELDQLFDAHLAQSAQLLSSQAAHELLELEPLEHQDLQQYARQFAVQLWDRHGRLLLRMGQAPAGRFSATDSGFSDAIVAGRQWRVFSDWDVDHQILVQMAEPHEARERLSAQIAINAMRPMLLAMPLMAVLIWIIVNHGLAPVRRIGEEVARRDPGNLQALMIERLPVEVQPLLSRINDLLQRIERSIENEKRFTADAAHELRNPVAAISTQAEALIGASEISVIRTGLSRIVDSASRLSRVVDQLLALARLDAKVDRAALVDVDLVGLTRQTLAELTPSVLAQGGSVMLDAPSSAIVRADPALIEVVIRNLIDNAMRHGSKTAQIAVKIACDGTRVEWIVADDGPGVPEQLRDQLGRRFFRAPEPVSSGSGLGLSIVTRIVQLHHALIRFEEAASGRGLCVRITFPMLSGNAS